MNEQFKDWSEVLQRYKTGIMMQDWDESHARFGREREM